VKSAGEESAFLTFFSNLFSPRKIRLKNLFRQGSYMRNSPRNTSSRGLWIAFFGPDGAGKSAVIDNLASQLERGFAGVLKFHFRPMFRSHELNRPPVTAPHSQPARGALASLGKLIYWLLDCWLGYLVTIRPAIARSRLVIFDRYLPDILVDPRRYRLPDSCLWFARMLVSLAPRPQLCILLDASAEVVQQRKREVSPAESRRQRSAYLAMFEILPNAVRVDASRPVAETVQELIAAIYMFFINSSSQSREASLLANL
jgi:thymidylate kinase